MNQIRHKIRNHVDTPIDKMFETTADYDTKILPENRWMAIVVGNHTSDIKRMVERIVKNATNLSIQKTNV